MDRFAEIFQSAVMGLCFAALVLMVAGAAVVVSISVASRAGRKLKDSGRSAVAAMLALSAVAIIYGGSKSGSASRFFYNGVSGLAGGETYSTNDTVHIEWAYNPDFIGIEDETVYVAYALISDYTNSVGDCWTQLDQSWRITDRGAEFTLEGATNYHYYVWTEYVPPTPVVTNGVYHLSGFDRVDDGTNKYVSLRCSIRVTGTNGVETAIAPIRERNAQP